MCISLLYLKILKCCKYFYFHWYKKNVLFDPAASKWMILLSLHLGSKIICFFVYIMQILSGDLNVINQCWEVQNYAGICGFWPIWWIQPLCSWFRPCWLRSSKLCELLTVNLVLISQAGALSLQCNVVDFQISVSPSLYLCLSHLLSLGK